ncbi:MAG TPA: adenylate/guanylate cyclase domain-containing protein, partial [Bacteroidales bacterium]|nr:adenylate/guanylate cyclase domain-containing protein [Bacteroidales bacterium]
MACLLRLGFILAYLLAGSLVTASPEQATGSEKDLPYVSSIILNNDSVYPVAQGEGRDEKPVVVGHRFNNLVFEISGKHAVSMRFFLEGFDRQWTGWVGSLYKEYTNLPAGNYVFHAEYIDENGQSGKVQDLHVRILPAWYLSLPAVVIYLVFLAVIFRVLWLQLKLRFARTQFMLEHIINERTEDLIIEKEKTESLLANVLPKNTASELMAKGKATKIKYNFVTVLFSDIQGFTQIAEVMNPEVLIDELDRFFFYFDSVVEKYGIEKIKTIGDAYMCAGGIPEKNRTNPVEVILAALEMQSYMKRLKETARLEGIKYWDI